MSTLDIKVNFFFNEKEITTNQWKLGDLGPFLLRSTWDIYQKFLVQLDFPPHLEHSTTYFHRGGAKSRALKVNFY